MEQVFDIIASTSDGAFAVNGDQRIVLWNRAAERTLGYGREEALGGRCFQLIGGRDDKGCLICRRDCEAMRAAKARTEVHTSDALARRKDGRDLWINVSTLLVPSRNEHLSVLVHLFRDVSREKHLIATLADFVQAMSEVTHPSQSDTPPEAATIEMTSREREILSLLALGLSTDSLAKELFISRRTVRNHIQNLLNRLGVHSRLEAVAYAHKHGLA